MSNIACEHGIPVGLFDAMIIRESQYQPNIYSPKNAFGLTQLMPGTAAQLGVDRYHVESNLRGGAKYLRRQLDRFGHYHLALAAYNAGPGRVRNGAVPRIKSEEHTSELQSLMRTSYAVFCLQKQLDSKDLPILYVVSTQDLTSTPTHPRHYCA